MSTRLLPRLLLFAFLTAAAAAQQQLAFPRLTGRVVDEADVLHPSAEADLGRELEAHERATGEQVVVATLHSLQGHTVEELANRLFREWRLGRAEQDDGALLVVAPRERKVRIEVGYGLEGVLTDAASATIIQSLVLPRFRSGDMEGGIVAGTRGMLELLRPEDGAGAGREPSWTTGSQPTEEHPTRHVRADRASSPYRQAGASPTRVRSPRGWADACGMGRLERLLAGGAGQQLVEQGCLVQRALEWGWLLGQGWKLRRWRRIGQLVTTRPESIFCLPRISRAWLLEQVSLSRAALRARHGGSRLPSPALPVPPSVPHWRSHA
jgi:uncharacterized membrane protein YgcG